MSKRVRKTSIRSRHSFTLVELIVVLVILAILAAMLVPALTGYIKRARKVKFLEIIDAYRVAGAAVMSEYYGEMGAHDWPKTVNVSWYNKQKDKQGKEVDGEPWGRKVIQLVGGDRGEANREPYILVIGIGDPRDDSITLEEKYSVCYVAYVATAKDPAVFWIDGEISYTYPRDNPVKINKTGSGDDIRNWIKRPGKPDFPIQYFVVSNRTGKSIDDFWLDMSNGLKGHSEPYFH